MRTSPCTSSSPDDPAAFRTRDWTGLVEADPKGTFFHTPDYLKVWWEEFGSGSRLLPSSWTATAHWPCAPSRSWTGATFLGGFDVTDYMGPSGCPGAEDAVAKELLEAMRRDAVGPGGPAQPAPRRSVARSPGVMRPRRTACPTRDCPTAPPRSSTLPDSFEAYLAALPAKLRHEIRRKARRLVRSGPGYRRPRASTADTLPSDYDRFMELHRSQPGPEGQVHARRDGALLPAAG